MNKLIQSVLDQSKDILLGKDKEVKLAVTSILAGGHLLIEDIPGVGKTTLALLLAKLFGRSLSRVQFTNDLLPADIIGTSIYNKKTSSFEFLKGPLFGEMILADELNRATPKTQSALLQAMEEREISVDGETFSLSSHFLIIATQNPSRQIGTFPLPESQIDRFFMSLSLGLPLREFEERILIGEDSRKLIKELSPLLSRDEFDSICKEISEVSVSKDLLSYLLDILEVGRGKWSEGSALSPRAGQDLLKAGRVYAFLEGRDFVVPDDIQEVAPYVLGHRVGGRKGVELGQSMIRELLSEVSIH